MTMKVRNSSIVVTLCGVVILSGCWSSWNSQPTIITLGDNGLTVTIPEDFETIPSSLIENRQVTNQIVYSWRQPLSENQIEDWQTYSLNLVVTQSVIATWITYDQFAQTNMDKMQQYMVGYQKEEVTLESFECGDQEVEWIHTRFSIQDTSRQPKQTYMFHHYQFVYDNAWYIISLAWLPSESRTLSKTFKTVLTSITCE